MPTARDVAAQLGISVSTVGRALADDPRISATTKFRVASAANELGYVANRAARMMRGAPSDTIGVLVPDISNGFYATIAHGLAEVLGQRGYQLVLVETGDDPDTESDALRALSAAQVAGVVTVPAPRRQPSAVRILDTIPHGSLLREASGSTAPRFGIDDAQCLRAATEHLLALGHERIAYLGGTNDITTGAARRLGYEAAYGHAGRAVPEGLAELGSAGSVDHGAAAVTRLLSTANPPTALVTASVPITQGVLEALFARRTRVPETLSVVGFGDEAGWNWWGPGLTTVSLPVHELAVAAARVVLDQIAGVRATQEGLVLGGKLVVRGSTAPPRQGLE